MITTTVFAFRYLKSQAKCLDISWGALDLFNKILTYNIPQPNSTRFSPLKFRKSNLVTQTPKS